MKQLFQKFLKLFRQKKKLPLFECDYVVGLDPGAKDKTVYVFYMKKPK